MYPEVTFKIAYYYKTGFKRSYIREVSFTKKKKNEVEVDLNMELKWHFKNDVGENVTLDEIGWCFNNEKGYSNNKPEQSLDRLFILDL